MATTSFDVHCPQPSAHTRTTALAMVFNASYTSTTIAAASALHGYKSFALPYQRDYAHSAFSPTATRPNYSTRAGPSSTTNHNRAHSEPPVSNTSGFDSIDVEMDPPTSTIKRSQSHWDFGRMHPADRTSPLPNGCVSASMPSLLKRCLPFLFATPPISSPSRSIQPTLDEVSESQELAAASQSQPRSVSPAPTEIDDPEPEYVAGKLHSLGVKIRDLAYEKTTLPPIPELFDQYDAIGEFEYRLAQRPRLYPIQGKTIRRLLVLGWIDQSEVDERCHEMDREELRKVDSRMHWPFELRFRDPQCRVRPTLGERNLHMRARNWGYMRMDRLRRTAELDILRREQDSEEARLALAAIRQRERMQEQEQGPSGLKRSHVDDGEEFDEKRMSKAEGKRRRMELEDEWEMEEQPCSQQMMPLKQYPAPLSSYDPEIYPEAAGAIESQSQSQPRPAPPPRMDTPPLEEEDTRPNRLRRPVKGLKRTLSRTQTFTQL